MSKKQLFRQIDRDTVNPGTAAAIKNYINKLEEPKKVKIKTFKDIPTDTTEGKLLLAAIAVITTLPGFADKTPDQALQRIKTTAWHMYDEQGANDGPEANSPTK